MAKINLEGRTIDYEIVYSREGCIDILWNECVNGKKNNVCGDIVVSGEKLKVGAKDCQKEIQKNRY